MQQKKFFGGNYPKKKIIALLLCGLLCLSLFACNTAPVEDDGHNHEEYVEDTATPTEDAEAETQPADDHSDHAHINYKGLTSGATTLADVEAVEGKAPDFSFEAGGNTYYAYNNVTFDSLTFDQVQISFGEGYVRISCTRTTESGLDEIYSGWDEAMKGMFGTPSQISENENVAKWADHTGNYITLTQLNETTVQLCYYLVA